jgi:hypothetical protein
MAFDLACARLGGACRAGAIKRDLERRIGAWLQELADHMAASVQADSAALTSEPTELRGRRHFLGLN